MWLENKLIVYIKLLNRKILRTNNNEVKRILIFRIVNQLVHEKQQEVMLKFFF